MSQLLFLVPFLGQAETPPELLATKCSRHPFSLLWNDTFEFTAHVVPSSCLCIQSFPSPVPVLFLSKTSGSPLAFGKKIHCLCLFLFLFNMYKSLTLGVGCSWLLEEYLYLAAANVTERTGNSGMRRVSGSSPGAITHCHDSGQVT